MPRPKKKSKKSCSLCGTLGHNHRGCPQRRLTSQLDIRTFVVPLTKQSGSTNSGQQPATEDYTRQPGRRSWTQESVPCHLADESTSQGPSDQSGYQISSSDSSRKRSSIHLGPSSHPNKSVYVPQKPSSKLELESLHKALVGAPLRIDTTIPSRSGDCLYVAVKVGASIKDSIQTMRNKTFKWVSEEIDKDSWAPEQVGPQTFEAYLEKIKGDGYGDEITLTALSKLYQLNYFIVRPNSLVSQSMMSNARIVFLAHMPSAVHYMLIRVSLNSKRN